MFDGMKNLAAAAANIGALVEQIDVDQVAALAGSLVQWAERMESAIVRIEAAIARMEDQQCVRTRIVADALIVRIEAAIARMEDQQRVRTRIVADAFLDDDPDPGSGGLPT